MIAQNFFTLGEQLVVEHATFEHSTINLWETIFCSQGNLLGGNTQSQSKLDLLESLRQIGRGLKKIDA